MSRDNQYIVIAYEDNEFVTSYFESKQLAEAHFHNYAHYTECDAIMLDQYMNVILQA